MIDPTDVIARNTSAGSRRTSTHGSASLYVRTKSCSAKAAVPAVRVEPRPDGRRAELKHRVDRREHVDHAGEQRHPVVVNIGWGRGELNPATGRRPAVHEHRQPAGEVA